MPTALLTCCISWARAKHVTAPGLAWRAHFCSFHTQTIQKSALKFNRKMGTSTPVLQSLQAQSRLLTDGRWWVLLWVPHSYSASVSCLSRWVLWKEGKDKADTTALLKERFSISMLTVPIICLLLGFIWIITSSCCFSSIHAISLSNILPHSLVKIEAIHNS